MAEYPGGDRSRRTLKALHTHLGGNGWHHRYSNLDVEGGCFLARTCWLVEAWARVGNTDRAQGLFEKAMEGPDRVGLYSEMIDPILGCFQGNSPQGLTHLPALKAALAIGGFGPER